MDLIVSLQIRHVFYRNVSLVNSISWLTVTNRFSITSINTKFEVQHWSCCSSFVERIQCITNNLKNSLMSMVWDSLVNIKTLTQFILVNRKIPRNDILTRSWISWLGASHSLTKKIEDVLTFIDIGTMHKFVIIWWIWMQYFGRIDMMLATVVS